MRIVNGIVYLFLVGCVAFEKVDKGEENPKLQMWKTFWKEHFYLLILLLIVNTVSFGMTFLPESQEIYIEKSGYGEEEKEISFLLEKDEDKEEVTLTVSARQLQPEELEKRVEETFAYLKENMKGSNVSLDKVCENLDYSFDTERFPFDAEFVSEDYTLINEEGIVQNDREYLLSMGFTEQEIEKGIPVQIKVTLWYGEESFQNTYLVKLYERQLSEVEQAFTLVKTLLNDAEQEASCEEGFSIPRVINEIEISRADEESVSPGQILFAGFILVVLLLLREQENKHKETKMRRENLLRSYPWFVNELVLLLGAGMQVRNILALLIRNYEEEKYGDDYRKPLIEEVRIAVRSMELGMTEEQAYYRLGRRIGLSCYVKVMTLLEQNVKRGGKGLIAVLEQEEAYALEERKNLAKRYGEEAGTKLLGPMILLLLVVMLMIMIPAFWGFLS